MYVRLFFFFSSRRRHTRSDRDWSSDVCSSDLRHSYREVWPPWYSSHRKGNNRFTEIAAREHGLSEHGFTVHNPFRYWRYIPRHNRSGENGCAGPLVKSLRVGSSPIRVNDYIVIDPEDIVPLGGVEGT